MKRLLAISLLVFFAMAASASAIPGRWAVGFIELEVRQNCHEYPAFRCVGWEVTHCYKISDRKVRCEAVQEYIHRGRWRACEFRATAIEERRGGSAYVHFGAPYCYDESGNVV